MPEPLQAGDVLLTSEAPLGEVAYLADTQRFCLGQRLFALRADEAVLDSRYLYYWLRGPVAQAELARLATGTTVLGIRQAALVEVPIDLPRVPIQRRIAATLGAFDDLIENNRRRIEILEEMARLIYREWFVHFRFPGHEDVELVDSDVGPIPAGWDWQPASEAISINPRERIDKNEERPFVTMGDLSEWSMICGPSDTKAGSSGSRFRNGDTLFARITPCLENGKTGYVSCLEDGQVARGSTEFVVLRGRKVGPEFTYLTAREDSFRANAIASMSGASGRQRVRNECFDSYVIPVPTVELLASFREIVKPMFDLAFALNDQNRVLAEARDLLLPRLISGELDVSDLDLGDFDLDGSDLDGSGPNESGSGRAGSAKSDVELGTAV